MAIYDWNRNGKKDIQDDYLEYNIYKQSTQNNNNYNCNDNHTNNNYSSGCGISNFGAGCATFLTVVISACIAGAMGLDGAPLVIVFIILAAIIGGCIAWFFDEIGF